MKKISVAFLTMAMSSFAFANAPQAAPASEVAVAECEGAACTAEATDGHAVVADERAAELAKVDQQKKAAAPSSKVSMKEEAAKSQKTNSAAKK